MVAQFFSVVEATLPPNRFAPKEQTQENITKLAEEFVQKFSKAVESANAEDFDALIVDGGYWRDLVAFTNDYRTISKPNVLQAAKDRLKEVGAHGGKIDIAPRFDTLEDHAFIEFGFTFSTALGPCQATVRLVKTENGQVGALLLYTGLDGIHGVPEMARAGRISGDKNSPIPYDELRRQEIEDPKPSVLVIGGGHNGLATAARLKYLGLNVLTIDRFERVGDNWRKRYGSLALHDTLYSQELPYMKWPETFPKFIQAGKLANWLEHYVEALELNVWCKSNVVPEKTYFDEKEQKWHVTVLRNGDKEYNFVVQHLVMATGLSGGKPKMPAPFPGQEKYKNPIIHSAHHKGGKEWKGKKVLVVGSGSSGHDISLDLANHGAEPTMLQRSPTHVMTIKNGNIKTLAGDLMVEGVDLDYADRISETIPKAIVKATHQILMPKIAELDKELIEGLKKAGFQWYLGPDDAGFLLLSLERGGGYYFDSGCSERIVNGDIKMKPGEIDHFTEDEVVFKDGSTMSPDLIIFCTGFTGFKESVAETLGTKYANMMKPIWGLDSEGELQGLYRDSGIPNTYFMVGALTIARVNSKLTALQIVAEQHGKFGPRYDIEAQKKTGNYVDVAGMLYR